MPPRTITSGGKDRLHPAAALLAPVFETDPVITWLLSSLPSAAARSTYLPTYFHTLLKAAALNDAVFDEIDGWKCCSVLIPPGKRVDNTWTLIPAGLLSVLWTLGISGCRRMLLEYEPQTEKVKAKAFSKGEKYYYVFFIGTREDAQGRGLASELMRYHQDVVRKSGLPIWLEATTSRSRDLYARLGFEVVGEILLGKGKVGADGKAEVGGTGVPVWGMVWWPAKDVRRAVTPVSEAEGRKNGV